MTMQEYINEIKLSLTGGVLQLELDDSAIAQIVNSGLRELQRYVCTTKIITVPYTECIDLKEYDVNAIARIYRAETYTNNATTGNGLLDPMQVGLWQITSNMGNMYNMNNAIYRYASWNTMQQLANTMSTDLSYFYDDQDKKLYINTVLDNASKITIEYVPRFRNVEQITSDFWIDVLMRLSKALTKIALGRIRSRYTQSNALWTQDGETLLNEGNTELTELRTYLQQNTQLLYVID